MLCHLGQCWPTCGEKNFRGKTWSRRTIYIYLFINTLSRFSKSGYGWKDSKNIYMKFRWKVPLLAFVLFLKLLRANVLFFLLRIWPKHTCVYIPMRGEGKYFNNTYAKVSLLYVTVIFFHSFLLIDCSMLNNDVDIRTPVYFYYCYMY